MSNACSSLDIPLTSTRDADKKQFMRFTADKLTENSDKVNKILENAQFYADKHFIIKS